MVIWQLIGLFDDNDWTQVDTLVLLCAILLFLLFGLLRRVSFDENNIYRTWGSREKAVAFTAIKRIEQTGIRIGQGSRYWRLRHTDKDGQEQKFLFREGNFQHGAVKELVEAIQKVNPALEFEASHIWNQVEQQKRRKAKRKAKKE